MAQTLSADDVAAWDRDGFLIVRGVLTPEQAEEARQIAVVDPVLAAAAKGNNNYAETEEEHEKMSAAVAAVAAAETEPTPLKTVLSHADFSPGDEVCSAWGASARLVQPLAQLFRAPVKHYYSIFMRKEPQTGGWIYHQDCAPPAPPASLGLHPTPPLPHLRSPIGARADGYHYEQFLRPEGYASAMLALAPCTAANGCLRVYRGSHQLGRLEHSRVGAQQIADPERVAHAAEVLEEVECELEPGDVLYCAHPTTLLLPAGSGFADPMRMLVQSTATPSTPPHPTSPQPPAGPSSIPTPPPTTPSSSLPTRHRNCRRVAWMMRLWRSRLRSILQGCGPRISCPLGCSGGLVARTE